MPEEGKDNDLDKCIRDFSVEILCVSGYFYILHLYEYITLFSCSSISRYNHLLLEGQVLRLLTGVGVSLLSYGNWASGWLVDDL